MKKKIKKLISDLKLARKIDNDYYKILNESVYDSSINVLYSMYVDAAIESIMPDFEAVVGSDKFDDGRFVSDVLGDVVYNSFSVKEFKKCVKYYREKMKSI